MRARVVCVCVCVLGRPWPRDFQQIAKLEDRFKTRVLGILRNLGNVAGQGGARARCLCVCLCVRQAPPRDFQQIAKLEDRFKNSSSRYFEERRQCGRSRWCARAFMFLHALLGELPHHAIPYTFAEIENRFEISSSWYFEALRQRGRSQAAKTGARTATPQYKLPVSSDSSNSRAAS